ncbi:hypothetical protein ASD24_24310 [Paenibacillus sp. Root52]|uniref:hypothetical protein n=1 Tax=Paenibacillus sp. Root52 TaxID=1736552 RepID=UPI0006F74C03|nr:hypothetical protein [Paenibacillus sp. Root52]KQY90925.1 hypothetical protein ASD24_24310 [Paenibacillus sp. Root52]
MGGRDTAKGIKIQGVVAVLNSLTKEDWDTVTIEPEGTDKIDIKWELNNGKTRIEQVKSTESQIRKTQMLTFVNEMIAETPSAEEYVLTVIGSMTEDTSKFVGSLNNGTLNTSQLDDYNHLKNNSDKATIIVRGFDFEALEALASKLLHKLYETKNITLRAGELEKNTSALFHEFDRLPILRKSLSKTDLEAMLLNWIDKATNSDLNMNDRIELREALLEFRDEFDSLLNSLFDPNYKSREKISDIHKKHEQVFSIYEIQKRYYNLLNELQGYDNTRKLMLKLYEEDYLPIKNTTQEEYSKLPKILNDLSFNQIQGKIESSEPIKQFFAYLDELINQEY